jgi:4-hydroxy-2-oxoheptanedioate aldolase
MRKRMSTVGMVVLLSAPVPWLHAGQSAPPSPPPRSNPVIALLEQGKPAFSIWANYIGVGNDYHAAVTLQNNRNFDFIIYDLEHDPLDVEGLSRFLRALLDPAAIARDGVSATKPVVVRIPPNGREIRHNQWVVKQILDTGVAGLMFPHIETAEQALDAISATRYPQPPTAPNVRPEGLRGASNAIAARYWGMNGREYERRSDVWGLQPGADMLVILIIENKLGVENVRDIARALRDAHVKCILWAGGGDMSLSYGHDEKLTELGLRRVIDAGKEFGLPVGINGTRDFKERYAQGVRAFFDIGPAFAATGPSLTPDERKAVGR